MAESELTIVNHSILVPDPEQHMVLAAGPVLPSVIGSNRLHDVSELVAAALAQNPDKTIPVDKDTIQAGIEDGVSAAVIGLDADKRPNGLVYAFARGKVHDREGGEVLLPGQSVRWNGAVELGSMLGNWLTDLQEGEVDPVVPPYQGSRAIDAVGHLFSWEHPASDRIAATNQTNGRGSGAVMRAGGEKIGSKPTTRLKPAEGAPPGPVMVDLYRMTPTGNFAASRRLRGR